MLTEYKAVLGQSVLDVCLNTYQTLDYLYKLIVDSGYENVNYIPKSGDVFLYDKTLVINSNTSITKPTTNVTYATSSTINISGFSDSFNNDFNL